MEMELFTIFIDSQLQSFWNSKSSYKLIVPRVNDDVLCFSENPHIRAVVMVRDPIQRSCSHHRFSYQQFTAQGVPNFNDVVDIALAQGSRLDYLHRLALAAVVEYRHGLVNASMIKFLEAFHSPGPISMTRTYERCYNVFSVSLYFPFIYLWDDLLGYQNLLVVEGERISPSRSRRKLRGVLNNTLTIEYTKSSTQRSLEAEVNDIFRFIGLNTLDSLPESFEHKSRLIVLPEHEMNETSNRRMLKFYEPFNEMLALYLSRRRAKS